MSEEKPFAEAREDELTALQLCLDGFYWPSVRLSPGSARTLADALNVRVAQREARLRGALKQVLDALDEAHELHASGAVAMRATVAAMADAIRAGSAALGPNPPDYVPRAALVEAEAKVKALQAVNDLINDVLGDDRLHLQNAREVAAQAAAHLEAAGLRRPTDEELIAQLRERGYMIVNPRKKPKPSERQPWDPLYERSEATFSATHETGGTSIPPRPFDDAARWDPLQWRVLSEIQGGWRFEGPAGDRYDALGAHLGEARDRLREGLAAQRDIEAARR